MQSGNSLSKDYTAGILSLWWLLRYFPHAKVISSAPTHRQVVEIMFGEIAKQFHALKANSPWPVDEKCLTTTKLKLDDECYAIGFTTKESHGAVGKFQGFKSKNLLIVLTEAQAIDDSIFDQMIRLTAGANYRILELGNPLAPSGRFYDHCTQPHFGYNVIKLSAFDSPNVKAGREVVRGVVGQAYIDEIKSQWGTEHPYWYGLILGEFPQSSKDCVIPMEWILRAVDREIADNDELLVGGLDVSKKGADETVHVVLSGRKVSKIDAFHKVDVNETVGWAKRLILDDKLEGYGCDEGGLAGVAGFLEEDSFIRCPIFRIQFGGTVEGSSDFANVGAAMWWALRIAFQDNQISIPNDKVLIGQLAARKFEMTSHGKKRIRLEPKEEARSRGEASPDRGDALAIAWWVRRGLLASDPAPRFQNESSLSRKEIEPLEAPVLEASRVDSGDLESNDVDY